MKPDIMPYNEKGQRHGHWVRYNGDGSTFYSGNYLNGVASGCFKWYNNIGELREKTYYII